MKNLFLGIDVGTTAIKFGVIEQGKLLFKTSVPVTTYYEDKQKYQKAEEILAGIVDGVRVIPHHYEKNCSISALAQLCTVACLSLKRPMIAYLSGQTIRGGND